MSTIAYAEITNAREAATPGTSVPARGDGKPPGNPGVGTYVDAFAALVPAEVLTLHAVIISLTTKTIPAAGASTSGPSKPPALSPVTSIVPEDARTLQYAFWGLVLLSLVLYVLPRLRDGKEWDRCDWLRLWIAPLAFVGWTMLQRTTAFDAAFPAVLPNVRTVIALFLAVVLTAVTTTLARQADAKQLPPV